MLIDLRIAADAETIVVTSAAANFHQQIPNMLLVNTDENKLYAIGRTAEEIAAESLTTWANRPAAMTFFPAYSSDIFNPVYTEAFIRFYASAIHNEIRSLWSSFWLGRYDRFLVELQLGRFEDVATATKDEFIYGCFVNQWGFCGRLASLHINGDYIAGPNPALLHARRRQRQRWRFWG